MPCLLAYAETADSANSGAMFVLLAVGVAIVTAVLACVPMLLAQARRHPHREAIVGFAILWALLTAGSVVMTSMGRMKWNKEQLMRIESGYYDPRDTSDAPTTPWGAWAALGTGYTAMLAWAVAKKRPPEQ